MTSTRPHCRTHAGIFVLAAALFAAAPVAAKDVERDEVRRDLMAWLPGVYDDAPQLYLEQKLGAPPDGAHDRLYRVFAPVTAPQIGETVLYVETRAGGKDGKVTGQGVAVVTLGDTSGTVAMDLKPIRDPAAHAGADHDPAKAQTLAVDDAQPGCRLVWRRGGAQLRAQYAGGRCGMPGKAAAEASWILNDHELWITERMVDAKGRTTAGRPDGTAVRFSKANVFACLVTVRPPNAPEVKTPISLHDRGDRAAFPPITPDGKPFYLDLMNGKWVAADKESYWDLVRLTIIQGAPTDAKPGPVLGMMWSEPPTRRIGLDVGSISVRCNAGV